MTLLEEMLNSCVKENASEEAKTTLTEADLNAISEKVFAKLTADTKKEDGQTNINDNETDKEEKENI